MPNRGSGRGSTRGRGQNRSLFRIQKNSSPAAKSPAITVTTPGGKVVRSPVKTRSSSKNQDQRKPAGNLQQPSGGGGPTPSSSNTGTPTVPTKNSFEMLSDCDDDDNSLNSQGSLTPADKAKKAKFYKCSLPASSKRPPVIHVPSTLPCKIDALLTPPNVQYYIKATKVAMQVLALDKENFDKVLAIFKANDVKYFTYDSRDSKRVKIVLQGLIEELSIPEVIKLLGDFDITPREVKVLSKKTTATGTHVLYLLYFDKGSVKIQDLRQVKTLNGYIVNWRFFTKKPTDAAQCHRCQKFGHGSRNCNLPPRCVKCGMDHLTESCPLPRKATLKDAGNAEQHKPSVKCANCGGNHTANFRGCTSRKSYIEQQEKKKKPPASSSAKPGADRSSGHPPGWSRSWADVAAGRKPAPAQDDAADGDLFTMSEFLALARDMYATLSSCRNKVAQFMALSKLMQKYLCAV